MVLQSPGTTTGDHWLSWPLKSSSSQADPSPGVRYRASIEPGL